MKRTITLEQLRRELHSANEAVEDLNAGSSYDEIQGELEDADYESFCKQLSFLVKNKDPKSQALYDTFKKGWKDEYRDITVSEKFISIRDLHPTQNVIFANKSLVPMLNGKWQIGGKTAVEVVMSNKSVNVPLGDPLVVCNVGGTNYLIDGHHRWSKFYAFNPTCNLQAYIIEDKSGKGLFASSDDVLKFAQGTLAALGQDTINPQGNTDINMYDLANGGEEGGLKWMLDTVNKNTTPEVLQIAISSNLGKINGITDNATLARYLWQNLYTNMFEYAPAGVHDREYMPQYPSGMDPETAVDTISENTKFTMTIGQLKRLVKESTEQDDPDSNDEVPVHSYNSASLKKAVNTRLLNLFGNLAYFNGEYVEKVSPTDSKNAVEIYGPWWQFHHFVNGYLKQPNVWNIDGGYIYAYEDHLSLRINLVHTYYNPHEQTEYDAYLFEFPFRRCKISVENEGSKTYTIVEMTTKQVYTRGYGSWNPIKGRQTMTLKFKGDVLAKVSKRDLKDQNFGLELKNNIMKSVDDELDISSYDCSYSFNPETKSMSISCDGGGKAYGDGYSYSGSCKLKYWGDKWKVVSSYSDDDGGKHDSSIRDAALRICGNMASVFRNYGKKLPREVNVRLYVEYD